MFADDTKTQVWARDVLPILVRRAQAQCTITFKELTEELELPVRGYARKMSDVCRHIIKTLAQLERQDDWEGEIPHITSIVLKTTEGVVQICVKPLQEIEEVNRVRNNFRPS